MLKTTYKIFLKLLTFLVYVKRFVVFILRIVGRIFLRTGELLLPVTILPAYRAVLKLRRASDQAPHEAGIIFWLTNPIVLAILGIVFLLTGVIFENIVQAKATLTDEQKNLVLDLVPTEEGITEEVSIVSAPVAPPTYSSVVGVPVPNVPEEEIELIGDEGVTGVLNAPLIAPGAVSNRREIIKYAVQNGDTIYGIAAKFDVTVSTILQENGLRLTSILRPGDTLTILPVSGISYTIKKGDTLAKIAKNFNADASRIVEFNLLTDEKDIAIGEKLVIPGGVVPAPIVPKKIVVQSPNGFRNIAAPPSSVQAKNLGYIWPTTGRVITQYFKGRRHTGIDIDGDYSSPVYATADGVVEFAGWNKGGYGLMILVDHGNGLKSRYAHSSRLFVQKGDYVTKGQTIMMVGTTGRSTGTHLHFEILENGKYINPFKYVR